jgi:hypothetical protein
MTDQDHRDETPEDADVEAHGLKEAAAAGMSAAAMIAAGAGAAEAAQQPATSHPAAAQAANKAADAVQKEVADPTSKLTTNDPTEKQKPPGTTVVKKIPGTLKWGDVTLKRGITD